MNEKVTGAAPAVPVTLDQVLGAQRAVEQAVSMPAQARRRRNEVIRTYARQRLDAGQLNKAELARAVGMSENQLGRIISGYTSGVAQQRAHQPDPAQTTIDDI